MRCIDSRRPPPPPPTHKWRNPRVYSIQISMEFPGVQFWNAKTTVNRKPNESIELIEVNRDKLGNRKTQFPINRITDMCIKTSSVTWLHFMVWTESEGASRLTYVTIFWNVPPEADKKASQHARWSRGSSCHRVFNIPAASYWNHDRMGKKHRF